MKTVCSGSHLYVNDPSVEGQAITFGCSKAGDEFGQVYHLGTSVGPKGEGVVVLCVRLSDSSSGFTDSQTAKYLRVRTLPRFNEECQNAPLNSFESEESWGVLTGRCAKRRRKIYV